MPIGVDFAHGIARQMCVCVCVLNIGVAVLQGMTGANIDRELTLKLELTCLCWEQPIFLDSKVAVFQSLSLLLVFGIKWMGKSWRSRSVLRGNQKDESQAGQAAAAAGAEAAQGSAQNSARGPNRRALWHATRPEKRNQVEPVVDLTGEEGTFRI